MKVLKFLQSVFITGMVCNMLFIIFSLYCMVKVVNCQRQFNNVPHELVTYDVIDGCGITNKDKI